MTRKVEDSVRQSKFLVDERAKEGISNVKIKCDSVFLGLATGCFGSPSTISCHKSTREPLARSKRACVSAGYFIQGRNEETISESLLELEILANDQS